LAIVIVGRAKYTRARERSRRCDAKGAPTPRNFARARVYFARPTIAIAKIRDYSQSTFSLKRMRQLTLSLLFIKTKYKKIKNINSLLSLRQEIKYVGKSLAI